MKKILCAISLATIVHCAPAFKGEIEFKQPDATTFKGKIKGDEWFNWIEDDEAHVIKYSNKTKNFEYAGLKEIDGALDLAPSGVMVGSKLGTLSAEKSKIDKQILSDIWKRKKEMGSTFLQAQ